MSGRHLGLRFGALALVGILSAGLIHVAASTVAPTEPASAADLSQFDPGRIIDDSVFFNGNALNADQVQAFLNSKVSWCQQGAICLKDYRQSTENKPADAMCAGYSGTTSESAADIIARVGQSCGISQKALIVTLQKEQGLVTSTRPSSWAYTIAMGQGCPDTSACDSQYYGFFNQVYGAAHQFKRYTNPPGTSNFFTWYAPGNTWNILYSPDRGCGSSPVYVHNAATAGLYYYTPYQPNRASLNAGYGTGDGCSTYGNRNFYNYFTDWFGSTRGFDVPAAFADTYAANRSWLGYATEGVTCSATGCVQQFQSGAIAQGPSGTFAVPTDYTTAWRNYGREFGPIGVPVSGQVCGDMQNACRQEFTGGWLVSSANVGVRFVGSNVRTVWGYWGREYGPLGLPMTDSNCEPNGGMCTQLFQGGWIVQQDAIGIRVVPNASVTTWSNWGREYEFLGMPTSDPMPTNWSDYTQQFQGGVITVTNGRGQLTSSTDPWVGTALDNPWLGAAQSTAPLCTLNAGGCYRPYDGGWVVQSQAGTFVLPREVLRVWSDWGREYNILGYPTNGPSSNPTNGNYTQQFQGGVITVTNGRGQLTSSTDPWVGTALDNPWLGAAQSTAPLCTLNAGGCYRPYDGGWVVQSQAGTFVLPREVLRVWSDWGREYNILGYPTNGPSSNPTNGNYTQQFQGGVITVTNGRGQLTSSTDPWVGTALDNPWLGAAQSTAPLCTLNAGGCYRPYDGGWVVQSQAGTFVLPREVLRVWSDWGREYNILGYPTNGPSSNPTNGNYTQQFQGGVITVTNGRGQLTSSTDPWVGTALDNPWLGAAQSTAPLCTLNAGGCYRPYDGGWVVQSQAGTFVLPREVLRVWSDWGREYNILGYPTNGPSSNPTNGNYTQQFQGGVITVTNGRGYKQ